MMDKPSGVTNREAEWLEAHELALFLEAAAHYRPTREDLHPIPAEMRAPGQPACSSRLLRSSRGTDRVERPRLSP